MQARIDQNEKPTAIGTSSVDLVTPVPLAVDPITGYLMIIVADLTSAVSPVLRSDAKIDENGKETMLGWNGTAPQALITHAGYLAISF